METENAQSTPTKVCTKCGIEYPATREWFPVNKKSKSGFRSYCKCCAYKMRVDWISRNKEKEKEYNTKYRPKTIENKRKIQLEKQKSNRCLKCGRSLIGRKLLARYCNECKSERTKELKRYSYKRNVATVIKYNLKNRELIKKQRIKTEKEERENLADRYIVKLFKEKSGLTTEQIKTNSELIEVKRLIIKTKRLCKTLKN